jgi:hypothetical protein
MFERLQRRPRRAGAAPGQRNASPSRSAQLAQRRALRIGQHLGDLLAHIGAVHVRVRTARVHDGADLCALRIAQVEPFRKAIQPPAHVLRAEPIAALALGVGEHRVDLLAQQRAVLIRGPMMLVQQGADVLALRLGEVELLGHPLQVRVDAAGAAGMAVQRLGEGAAGRRAEAEREAEGGQRQGVGLEHAWSPNAVAGEGLFGTGAALAVLRVAPSTVCSVRGQSATPTQVMGKDRASDAGGRRGRGGECLVLSF